jgi:Predicted hydrolase of the alpha/beta-hydrolase fold
MKEKSFTLKTENHSAGAHLLVPNHAKDLGVILAHGAGGNMNAEFLRFFQKSIAVAGYPTMRFNFFYSEKGRRAPDPKPLLLACYNKAIETMPGARIVTGGKSMGGRMASYIADNDRVAGLVFLGYPLHAPGKFDELRDEHLYSISKAMFFASGTKDPFARIDLLKKVLKKIGKNASSFLIPDAGHSFEIGRKNDPAVWKNVADAIIVWLTRL